MYILFQFACRYRIAVAKSGIVCWQKHNFWWKLHRPDLLAGCIACVISSPLFMLFFFFFYCSLVEGAISVNAFTGTYRSLTLTAVVYLMWTQCSHGLAQICPFKKRWWKLWANFTSCFVCSRENCMDSNQWAWQMVCRSEVYFFALVGNRLKSLPTQSSQLGLKQTMRNLEQQ